MSFTPLDFRKAGFRVPQMDALGQVNKLVAQDEADAKAFTQRQDGLLVNIQNRQLEEKKLAMQAKRDAAVATARANAITEAKKNRLAEAASSEALLQSVMNGNGSTTVSETTPVLDKNLLLQDRIDTVNKDLTLPNAPDNSPIAEYTQVPEELTDEFAKKLYMEKYGDQLNAKPQGIAGKMSDGSTNLGVDMLKKVFSLGDSISNAYSDAGEAINPTRSVGETIEYDKKRALEQQGVQNLIEQDRIAPSTAPIPYDTFKAALLQTEKKKAREANLLRDKEIETRTQAEAKKTANIRKEVQDTILTDSNKATFREKGLLKDVTSTRNKTPKEYVTGLMEAGKHLKGREKAAYNKKVLGLTTTYQSSLAASSAKNADNLHELNKIGYTEAVKAKFKNSTTNTNDAKSLLAFIDSVPNKSDDGFFGAVANWVVGNGKGRITKRNLAKYATYAKSQDISEEAIKAGMMTLATDNWFFDNDMSKTPQEFVEMLKTLPQGNKTTVKY